MVKYKKIELIHSYLSKSGYQVECAGESSSERSLKVRRLLREQEKAGAIPAALTILRDANTGAGQDPHRPDCGG